MKKITTILLIFTISVTAQKKVNCDTFLKILNENRVLARKNNAVGIIDIKGNVIVPFNYKTEYELKNYQISSKLFASKDLNTNEQVLINIETGKNILEKTSNLREVFVIDDYAIIETGKSIIDDKRFYIDSEGNTLFELPQNEHNMSYVADSPHEGMIRLGRYDSNNSFFSNTQEIIYYNLKGEKIIDKAFKHFSGNFNNGLALNCTKKEGTYYYGFMDKNGTQKIDFKFSKPPTEFSDEMSRVESVDGKIGFINLSGEVVINPKYRDASGFYKGYALVQNENEQWFLIDKKDNIIEEYDKIRTFPYIPQNSQKTSYLSILIDEGVLAITNKYKRKMMNLKGELVFEEKDFKGKQFMGTYNFKNGYIIYNPYNPETRRRESKLMDKEGKEILIAERSTF